MGVYEVRMPQLGETVEEGTVVSWLKQPGDEIAEREAIVEISTDKVDTEVESSVAGVVRSLVVDEGETVAVGTVLAEIDTEDSGADADEPAQQEPAQTEAEPKPAEAGAAAEGPSSGEDLQLSPLVRRLVDEHDIDLDDLAAFADQPRVSRQTIEAYLEKRPADGAAEPAAADDADLVPFSRIRKLTAERMVASKATSPHVVTAIEVDFERIAALRAEHKEALRDRGIRLTWLPFIACAVVRTLGQYERLNGSVVDAQGLRVHPEVHLGIAVDLDGEGLVVPVLRAAGDLDVVGMAERIGDAADRARSRQLGPDDVSGGTFTITGQGPNGTLFTAPIINQPQVAILSVDGIRKRPVVLETSDGDEIVAHHTGVLAMSWDHRAVDGVYAAGFLAALRDAIEQHDWASELS